MNGFTAYAAKTRFSELPDRAHREPIGVLKHDRLVGVLVSVRDFKAMRTFYADRLQHRLNASAIAAERAGLTAEKLDSLLADER